MVCTVYLVVMPFTSIQLFLCFLSLEWIRFVLEGIDLSELIKLGIGHDNRRVGPG